ncbi:exonuclease SbcCD subunit D [Candidatus Epulonipiscium fishelsonii]|uniref:Exonuclease SbcCD subunit D n=1 Tax=Candidatus Epulonipiscium fishelsonii TaxID=77094 RepID=A0ACC8X7X7_9FIRM|nr:exonuclease SbcCD subunit D [Epulopiscium sp. SCG-B11WGA-EpuloA1]ONI41141.1 exonuclease SbcCD subunit D [Epulopiscium sp. SCG-B05WGA-EpuloA1]ONI47112.1 exonuclease SbcCD subunit D [Epulopiscium sp. SCG-C06WGA-EpuloA1]
MKILHTSDWHLGKTLDGYSRMDEQEKFLDDFIEIADKNDVNLIIIAGDVYDTSNPPARAEKMFYDALKRLSTNGERMIIIIAGNHDSPERLVSAGPLAMEHGIVMVGTPKTVVPAGKYGQNRVITSGEGFIEVELNNEKAVILTVPYPSEKRLNEVLYDDIESEQEQLASYTKRIKALFDKLEPKFRADTINIAISHIFTLGSEESGSERSIQLGGSFVVEGNCLPQKAQYIALGHLHKPQVVANTKARYSGSPIHYNKKEINFEKKCILIDVHAGTECIITDIALEVYKPIEIWKCANIEEALAKCEENLGRECWVYLEIETDSYILEKDIKALRHLKPDIVEIKANFKQNQKEEIISLQDKSFEELFIEFYKSRRSVQPTKELTELLLSIVEEEEYEAN